MATPAYVPPTVTAAGLTVASYDSILADNLQAFLNIYGQTQYVRPDAAIYQLLSILSLKQADQNNGLQLVYNQSSPQTAVGAGLDRQVKMNGLARAPFTYSTASLVCVGTAGVTLTNCFAQDQGGNLWALPSPVTLVGGTATVVATCTTPGNVTANPGAINIRATPVNGWAAVTNPYAAVSGDPVETDSQLRARQAVSVALPALTPVTSTVAVVYAVTGVTRVAPGYSTPGGPGSSIENPTGVADYWANPPHSISIVAEGGTDLAVATAIYSKKTIGCFTNGTTAVVVSDQYTGYEETISFFRPTYLPIFVLATLHGYSGTPTSATLTAVKSALTTYLNELQIGETVAVSALVYETMAVNAALTSPAFGVRSMLIGVATATTVATTTNGSSTIAVASASGVIVGQLAVGSGIPSGATVSGLSGLSITLSAVATASASGVSVVFATLSASDVPMPTYYTVAQGVSNDVSVVTA